MSAVQIPAPPPMSLVGEVAQNWLEFRESWGHYSIATGLEEKETAEDGSESPQGLRRSAATLCSVMGRDCLKVLNSLPTVTAAEKVRPDRILAALSDHFVPQRHVLFERYTFNSATQRQGESCDEFVVRLRQLSGSCEYGGLCESLIRDRLVYHTTDTHTRDRLLRERPVPNLARVIECLRAAELTQHHHHQMNTASVNVDSLHRKDHGTKGNSANSRKVGKGDTCSWCGRTPKHAREDSPAKSAECRNCSKIGHFKSVGRSRKATVHQVTSQRRSSAQPSQPGAQHSTPQFLGQVNAVLSDDTDWYETVYVNGRATRFKLDPGADVSLLGTDVPWLKEVALSKTKCPLLGPGRTSLKVTASLEGSLSCGGKKHAETLYLVENQPTSLLSRAACVHLGLVKRTRPNEKAVDLVSTDKVNEQYPEIFTGLGKISESYRITLSPDATPLCIYTPRKVPQPLYPQVKAELESMVETGVISPVTEPTDWCSGMVAVPKSNGTVRICVDLTTLNRAVKREVHPMASVDESLAQLAGSSIFSKLDANSGFWQIPLHDTSRLLTTFLTPFGRFCFNRLPFGISSAPEVFQRLMSELLRDIPNVICHMDDILVHGRDQETHDKSLKTVLDRLYAAGLTLSEEKCQFAASSITFLGHIIDSDGIKADPKKTAAIRDFPTPSTVTELQRFMGMVNQLSKFLPSLAKSNAPLRELLKKDREWIWDSAQQSAFQTIKDKLQAPESLAHYSIEHPTVIAADASSLGLGAVLIQIQPDGARRPIYYASRSLTPAEQNYAVNEKEALAVTWATEKFSDYVTGLDFTIETDHKPLVPLLTTTELCKLPLRIQRFRLRLMKHRAKVVHVPGKQQVIASV